MTLVTLQRRAPVAPDAPSCRLCDARIAGTFQDHLLVGQPGTSQVRAVLCQRCGESIVRLVEVCGPELSLLIQAGHQSVENLVGLPRVANRDRSASPADRSGVAGARQRLNEEADSLGRTEQRLRAEAEKLGP